MPDEPAVIAEPQEPPTDPNAQLPDGFGNLGAEMDRVFRSKPRTPRAPEPPATPQPPAAVAAPVAPVAPEPPVPATPPPVIDDGFLPADIFGEAPKPAAPPVPEEIPIPEGLTKPKDIATWKELRTRLHEAESKLPKTEAELNEWKTKYETARPEELQAKITETEKINQQMSERIAVVDLQIHPEFQRQFTAPRAGLVQSATELIKESDIEPEQFDKAMKMTGKARRQALDEIIQNVESPTLTGQLGVIFNQIEDLDRRRAGALADAKGNWERLQEHDKTVRYEARQNEIKHYQGLTDQIEKELADENGIVFLKRSASNEEWNKNIDEENKATKELVTIGKDPAKFCKVARLGMAFPRVYNWALTVHKKNQQLEQQLSEFKSAEPSLNGMRTPSTGQTEANKKLTFAQAAAAGSGLPF